MNNLHAYFVENAGSLLVFQQAIALHSLEYPAIDELFPRLKDSTLECLSETTSQGTVNIDELTKLYEVSALGELNDISEEILMSFKDGAIKEKNHQLAKSLKL